MNLLFGPTDKAFEAAPLSAERCEKLLASQMQLRRFGVILAAIALIFATLFIGSLVIGDSEKSRAWKWIMSPDPEHSHSWKIGAGGSVCIVLLCSAGGMIIGADFRIKLLLAIRAIQHRLPTPK